jgi:DNA-binding XRE family transcriptional regulator
MRNEPLPPDPSAPISNNVGRILRRYREELGLSQEQVAHAAGVSPMCVHWVETHQRNPKFQTVEKICRALKKSLAVVVIEAANES